jgi:hypothetical protein
MQPVLHPDGPACRRERWYLRDLLEWGLRGGHDDLRLGMIGHAALGAPVR